MALGLVKRVCNRDGTAITNQEHELSTTFSKKEADKPRIQPRLKEKRLSLAIEAIHRAPNHRVKNLAPMSAKDLALMQRGLDIARISKYGAGLIANAWVIILNHVLVMLNLLKQIGPLEGG